MSTYMTEMQSFDNLDTASASTNNENLQQDASRQNFATTSRRWKNIAIIALVTCLVVVVGIAGLVLWSRTSSTSSSELGDTNKMGLRADAQISSNYTAQGSLHNDVMHY